MPAGRPPRFTDPAEMDRLVDEYIALCEEKGKPVLLTGMILHLGLSSRSALDLYAERPEFMNSVKRAKIFVEMAYEERLVARGGSGDIFALKNFGWKDKQEQEITGSMKNDNTWTIKFDE